MYVCSFVGIQYVRSRVCEESACVWVSMILGYIRDRLSDIHITYFATFIIAIGTLHMYIFIPLSA